MGFQVSMSYAASVSCFFETQTARKILAHGYVQVWSLEIGSRFDAHLGRPTLLSLFKYTFLGNPATDSLLLLVRLRFGKTALIRKALKPGLRVLEARRTSGPVFMLSGIVALEWESAVAVVCARRAIYRPVIEVLHVYLLYRATLAYPFSPHLCGLELDFAYME